jgi:hypothetical protein
VKKREAFHCRGNATIENNKIKNKKTLLVLNWKHSGNKMKDIKLSELSYQHNQ